MHIPDAKRSKFDAKSIECVHLGYAEHKKAYILLHKPSNRIVESRDVHFDEGALGGQSRVIIDPKDAPDDGDNDADTDAGGMMRMIVIPCRLGQSYAAATFRTDRLRLRTLRNCGRMTP